eukprot:1096017-Rhodomonas_salina.1
MSLNKRAGCLRSHCFCRKNSVSSTDPRARQPSAAERKSCDDVHVANLRLFCSIPADREVASPE